MRTIAGFVAYIAICSPTAMRLSIQPVKTRLEQHAIRLEELGKLPPPPPELGAKSIAELIADKKIAYEVDERYPQAIGISNIRERIETFENAVWEILVNDAQESSFFTSDFPVAVEVTSDPLHSNRVVALAPDIAIRIMPRRNRRGFECATIKLKEFGVRQINKLIVRCAESLVFYRDEDHWRKRFVERNSKFRIEAVVEQRDGRTLVRQMPVEQRT